jgi:hypothetical protein
LAVIGAGVLLPLIVNEATKPALPKDVDDPDDMAGAQQTQQEGAA